MTAEPSPRPWRVKQSPIGSNAWIVSGETFVASVSRSVDAALIVDAVNERDRLRDVIRDIGKTAKHALGYLHAVAPREAFLNIAPSDLRDIVEIARAAVGEDAP